MVSSTSVSVKGHFIPLKNTICQYVNIEHYLYWNSSPHIVVSPVSGANEHPIKCIAWPVEPVVQVVPVDLIDRRDLVPVTGHKHSGEVDTVVGHHPILNLHQW